VLEIARVVAIHPHDHSIDALILRTGQRVSGVPMLTAGASTTSGRSDLPPVQAPEGDGRWNLPQRSQADALVALAPTAHGHWVAVGCLFPQQNAVLSPTPGVAVYRHHSGAWTMIANDGTMTVGHPSGALISMGPGGGAPPNPVGGDADGLWQHAGPNAAAPVALTLTMPAGAIISIDTAGKVSITAPAEVAFTVPKITTTGDIEALGDVKAGTISLKNHVHGGVDPGGGTTAPPSA
jgi:phage baseplate assembly protein gpV